MHAAKNCCMTQHPNPDEVSLHSKSSIQTENRAGLKTPPCLVPALSVNFSEYAPPHLTIPKLFEYQHSMILMKNKGHRLFINFTNSACIFNRSKALLTSSAHKLTVEPFLVKYSTTLLTV